MDLNGRLGVNSIAAKVKQNKISIQWRYAYLLHFYDMIWYGTCMIWYAISMLCYEILKNDMICYAIVLYGMVCHAMRF